MTIEKHMGKNAKLNFLPMQPGDVKRTWADTEKLAKYCKYHPKININDGIKEFID